MKDDCHKCERFKVGDSRIEHKDKMLSDALDLINRKDAEIDILKTEIEKLKNLVADKGGLILMETAKTEAIKEFTEIVYRFFCNRQNWKTLKEQWLENGECYWLKEKLNNLVKEMVGEKNGQAKRKIKKDAFRRARKGGRI